MADDGHFLLFFPQRYPVVVKSIQLFLEVEILFLQPDHFLHMLESLLDGKDQEQTHQHQDSQHDQRIDLESWLEQFIRVQSEIPLVGMIIAQQQGHRPQIGPEGGSWKSQLCRGKETSHDLQCQGHPQKKQEKINDEIRQDPIHMPGIRQKQFEHFQRQGMDKDHIDGLKSQHKQMTEPEGPDGQHQKQQVGQIAEQIQELEHAAFQFQGSPIEKSRQQQEFQEKNSQMPQQQLLPSTGTDYGPKGIVPKISRGKQGKAEQEQRGKTITHGRNHLQTLLILL